MNNSNSIKSSDVSKYTHRTRNNIRLFKIRPVRRLLIFKDDKVQEIPEKESEGYTQCYLENGNANIQRVRNDNIVSLLKTDNVA